LSAGDYLHETGDKFANMLRRKQTNKLDSNPLREMEPETSKFKLVIDHFRTISIKPR